MKSRKPNASSHMTFSVTYQTMVLNADGSIAKKNPPKHNLILDGGLDKIGTIAIVDAFRYAAVGTGSTPTNRDSATTTFTRSGTTVTANANFFEADDVGRLLKFDTGEEMYIVTFNSVTEVVVDTSGTLTASEGTVWYVNETGHQTETKRTGSYATESGDNSSTLLTGVLTHKRTFLFGAEVGPVTYTEIGWSDGATSATSLFGRDIIAGGGDSLVAGQQYKVVFQLAITLSPATSTAVTDVGNNGFSTAGNAVIYSIYSLSLVSSTGAKLRSSFSDPGVYDTSLSKVGIYTADFTLAAGPTLSQAAIPADINALGSVTTSSYSNGNFYRDVAVKLGVNDGNTANMYGFSLQTGSIEYFQIKLTTTQTKDSDHTLTFTFRQSWDRTLTN